MRQKDALQTEKFSMEIEKNDLHINLGITKEDQGNVKVTCIVKEKVHVLRLYKIDKDLTKQKAGSVSDGN